MSIDIRSRQYGAIFDNWMIEKRVGNGSSGKTVVFQLNRVDSTWEEVSALKVVTIVEENGKIESLAESYKNSYEEKREELSKKAKEEVHLMYELRNSPYIVNYFDYKFLDWKEENQFGRDLLIRMEFLDTLDDLLKQEIYYDEQQIIQIGKDICKALIHCHKKSIIHRDIKSANIFKNSEDTYKLGDFGIARMVENSNVATTMTGTAAYAAPEQFAQNAEQKYDYRVDIYSLGLVLYELSNENRLPFASSRYVREEENQLRIMGKPLPMPSNASEAFGKVILKACAYEPKDRYQSAQEFLNALIEVEQEEKSMKTQKKVQFKKEENSNKDLYATVPATRQNQEKQGVFEIVREEKKQENIQEIKTWFQKTFNLGRHKKTLEIDYDYLVGKDEKEVFKYYQKIAKQGNVEAQYELGNYYYNGKVVEQNYSKAVKYYQKAIEQGNMEAQFMLGECYYYGRGVQKDYSEAVKCYKPKAIKGNAEAQVKVGYCYLNMKNYSKAVKWFEKAAEQGQIDADVQCELGTCYYYGRGVQKDYSKAVKFYQKIGEQGNAEAQANLGSCYYYGYGVEQDYNEAVKWYEKAVNQGYTEKKVIYYNLGECYYYGYGVKQDYIQAVEWYHRAEYGHKGAQYKLGKCYYHGYGVKQDYVQAVEWYRKAAEKGYMEAQYDLGNCYYKGKGVRQDYVQAVKWYEKAANQGHIEAKYELGNCYYYG